MADRNTVSVFLQDGARLFYLSGKARTVVSERCLGSNTRTRTNWTLINCGPSLSWYARNECTREISQEFKTRTQALQFAAHWQVAEDHAARGFARIQKMMTADQLHLV